MLRRWFRKQHRVVLASIPMDGGLLPMHLPRLQSRDWVDPMAHEVVPLLRPYWSRAYRDEAARLSRRRDLVDVGVALNPHLRAQIEKQSFAFCRSTNESTSRRLDEALEALKLKFVQGLVERGDSARQLAKQVNTIFDGLTERHAYTIAVTEASRAHHAAQEMAAQESGIVAGKELLISEDACPLCQKIATEVKMVRLGQPFAIVGDHPEYSTVMYPPLHPNCRCSLIDVLLPEYGGPADPDWGLTIFHPEDEIRDLGGEYKPPLGLKIPEPEPERLEGRPNGRAVGDALMVQTDQFGDKLSVAIRAIDSVHGDGSLPRIPVNSTLSPEYNGVFYAKEQPLTGKKQSIEISMLGDHPNMSLVHEVGHFLDFSSGIGDRECMDYRPWSRDSVFSEWYKAILNSDSMKRLAEFRNYAIESGGRVRYYDYVMQVHEIWARSYAQYIVTKSGDLTMKAELDAMRSKAGYSVHPTQWSDNDFKPIELAIDNMFKKVGWIK